MKQLIIFFGVLLLVSCKNETPAASKTQTQLIHEDIMRVHDDVMPKTADIHRVIKKLKEEKKTITQNNNSLIAMFDDIINDLKQADDGMSEWMANYKKPDFDDVSEATQLKLRKEKEKIVDVRDDILNALNKGNKFHAHIHKNNPANTK
jgi:predicted transcriptional regulator